MSQERLQDVFGSFTKRFRYFSCLSHEEPPELEELIRLVAGKLVRVLDCFHPALGALGLGLKLFEIGGVSL